MESTDKAAAMRKKKKKRGVFLWLFLVLIIFTLFGFLLTRPSRKTIAIREVQLCTTLEMVKHVFEKYQFELVEKDENGNVMVDSEFQMEIRKKLTSYKLSDSEFKYCQSWLPPAPTSINVIVVPDLSFRIRDSTNNPNQVNYDKEVLGYIWKSFVDYSKYKMNSKDRLVVNVTDLNQARGQFEKYSNALNFDLSTIRDGSNRFYFTKEKEARFMTNITLLYATSVTKTLGANYRHYISTYLNDNLKKTTLFDNYINKVIFITDGYIEYRLDPPNNNKVISDTKISSYEKYLYPAVESGDVLSTIKQLKLEIPKVDIDLSNTQVMVCEVNARKAGLNHDIPILKAYWEDWFDRMNVSKKITFEKHNQSTVLTAQHIREFIFQ